MVDYKLLYENSLKLIKIKEEEIEEQQKIIDGLVKQTEVIHPYVYETNKENNKLRIEIEHLKGQLKRIKANEEIAVGDIIQNKNGEYYKILQIDNVVLAIGKIEYSNKTKNWVNTTYETFICKKQDISQSLQELGYIVIKKENINNKNDKKA